MASFSDARCTAGGVCSNDPLVFTCEVNDAYVLRVVLPTGDQEVVSVGDTTSDISLPAGFTAVALVVTLTDDSTRNISLTLSTENASLLNGSQITCDDASINDISAMAGCPLAGEPSVDHYKRRIHACTCRAAWIIIYTCSVQKCSPHNSIVMDNQCIRQVNEKFFKLESGI